MKRRFLSILMATALCATSAMPSTAYAQTNIDLGKLKLKTTEEVDWIDRLDLSSDTNGVFRKLYDTLVEASDNDGTDDYLIRDEYFNTSEGLNSIPVVKLTGVLKDGETLETIMNEIYSVYADYIQAVCDAFDRDHPEVFWLDGGISSDCSAEATGNNYTITISIVFQDKSESYDVRATNYQSQSAIQDAISIRDTKVKEIINDVSGKTEYEKLEYFNKILTESNEYNTSSDLNNIAHDCRECTTALNGSVGTAGPVCESYARAFKVLCDKVEIPCILVDGKAKNSTSSNSDGEAHMWNYVQIGNNWYAVDVTWNDPKVEGKSGAVSGHEGEKYLLIGSDTQNNNMPFSSSHTTQNQASVGGLEFINQPTLSTNKYDSSVKTQETEPNVIIDYSAEKLDFAGINATYEIFNNEGSILSSITDSKLSIEEAWLGTTISVVKSARDESYSDSNAVKITVPARPASPSALTIVNIEKDMETGKITGLDSGITYEYRLSGTETWISVTGKHEITGLSSGDYEVRIASGKESFASEAVTYIIEANTSSETSPDAPESGDNGDGNNDGGSNDSGNNDGGNNDGGNNDGGNNDGGNNGGGSTSGGSTGGGSNAGNTSENVSTSTGNTNTTTQTKPDGTKVETKTETTVDGSKKETVTETTTDGTKKETVTETKADGTKKETVTTTNTDGSKEVVVTKENKDGSVKEVVTTTKANGSTVKTTVSKDATGNIVSSKATVTDFGTTKTNSENVKYKITKSLMEQLSKTLSGEDKKATIVVSNAKKETLYKVVVNVEDMKVGNELYICVQNSKGEYVLFNEDVYKVSKNGNLNINMSEKKKYVLLNKEDMQKLTNKILETATLKNKQSTVEKGNRTKVEFSKEFDMKNVEKITYSSTDKKVAVVSKKGSIRTK